MAAKVLENDKVNIRMPDGLRNRIKAAAALHGRSLNNEIVVALLDRFPELPSEAKAVVDLIDYIRAADDDLELSTRAAEVESRLRQLNRAARVEVGEDGSITIRAA